MIIKEIDLFKGIDLEVLNKIVDICSEENYTKDTVLFSKGDDAERLYILEEGTVKLLIQNGGTISNSLTEPGDIFGWSCMVESGRYTASGICATDVKAVMIERNKLNNIFDLHPDIGLKIVRRLAGVFSKRISSYDKETVINKLLRYSLEDMPIETLLERTLQLILSIPWLALKKQGCIFLVEDDSKMLTMKAQSRLAEPIKKACANLPFGMCHCGRAALTQEIQFVDCLDESHDIRYDGIMTHGHYCVPILYKNETLGVINLYIREGHHRDQREIEFLVAVANTLAGIIRRKRLEKELKETFDFMNKIVQSSPNPTMATDLKGNIIIWNLAAEETLGYKAGEVIGKMNIDKIYPEYMARKVMQMRRGDEYGGGGRLKAYPMVYVRRDGEVVEGTLSAVTIYDANGNEVATVESFVDLRERLEMERALRRTQEQLLQSEKLAAMGRLTSQIAHELNNPLYGIMNTLELLKTEVAPQSKRRKILEMALSETLRLSDLLRKMLSFSKPDQEQRQPVDINTVIDEILMLHEKQLRENDIRIASTFTDGLGRVNASKNQLRQVFLNMVANARDAMANGGTLTVSTSGDGENVIIEITDTGSGIKENHMDKIFDSFFTTKGEVKGVGLGLSVCYGFIKDHDGDIVVKSEVGTGTTFVITLPVFSDNRV